MQQVESNDATTGAALRRELGYITHAQLCALLGIAAKTGENRKAAGQFPPHYKLGRERVYRLTEVQAWIRRRRVDRAEASK